MVSELKPQLESYGFTVYIDYMPLEPSKTMKSKDWKTEQSRELSSRVERVNSICAKHAGNCLYISLHNDAIGVDGKWHDCGGYSVFTTPGITNSDRLAECIYDAAERNLADYKQMFFEAKARGEYGRSQQPIRTDKRDGDRDFESNLYVIRRSKCPAVLVEQLFQDNKNDVDFLLSDDGRLALQRTIIEGVLKYCES
jgi:N-acetylmuramoyl-L-alanine amidase